MADFTGGGIHALPRTHGTTGDPDIDRQIHDLVEQWGCGTSADLVQEMIVTALKMGRDQLAVADLKLFNRSLKELRHAAKVFTQYTDFRKVVVFGSARTASTAPEALAAEEFARKMREHEYMIITGGDGIMGAAQRGAGREHSFGLNIRLPFEQRANETIHGDPKLINFNYFFTRKLNFVKETHAIALFPGGFGTMDEGFEVLTLMQTGKGRIIPYVLVDQPNGHYWETWRRFLTDDLLRQGLISPDDFHFFKITHDVDEAVAEILRFYRNYRSYRWVGSRLVFRLQQRIAESSLERLNDEFADIIQTGAIVQSEALPEEQNEPSLFDLPRLVLKPFRRNFGRFRQLINAINDAETVD